MKHINDKLEMLRYLQLGTLLLTGSVKTPIDDESKYFAGLVVDKDNLVAVHHYFLNFGEGTDELEAADWYPGAYGPTPEAALNTLDARLAKIVLSSDVIGQWLGGVTGVERGLAHMKKINNFSPRSFAELSLEF